MRVLDAEAVRRGLRHRERLFRENVDPEGDPNWIRLCDQLRGIGAEGAELPGKVSMTFNSRARQLLRHLWQARFWPGKPVRTALPENAIYVNIGQCVVGAPLLFRLLRNRPDICVVMMMHDVIPLEYPQFVARKSVMYHKGVVRAVANYAHGMIVPTRAAEKSIAGALAAYGRTSIPTLARHLPLAPVFAEGGEAPPELAGLKYFVICSGIEPRKNHALLFEVWRRLIAQLGDAAPHLVVVGSPAWGGEKVLELLRMDPVLHRRVYNASRLTSPALKKLMIGSAGVMMPSFTEGFGLPILEANALGVPTIASDIAPHREIANDATILLPPDDPEAWQAAIMALPSGSGRVSPAPSHQLSQARYGKDIEAFLEECRSRHLSARMAGRVEQSPVLA